MSAGSDIAAGGSGVAVGKAGDRTERRRDADSAVSNRGADADIALVGGEAEGARRRVAGGILDDQRVRCRPRRADRTGLDAHDIGA